MDKEQEVVGQNEEVELESSELVVQAGRGSEVSMETEGFIEQVEKTGEKTAPMPTDDQGQPLTQQVIQSQDDSSANAQLPDDAVVLPMTQQEFEEGIHAPLVRAVRWLAEWCAYIIKKFGEKVFFRG